MDNKAYQKMDYALCLLSAAADGKRHGCIVNSFHQVTSSFPPKFTVAVNQGPRDLQGHSGGGELLRYPVGCGRAGGDHRPVRLQVRPGDGQVRRPGGGDRQQRQSIPEGAHGLPHRMQGGGPDGDRQLPPFRGPGTEAEVLGDGRVLTLQAYTDRGKATPPTATVYRTVEINGYRCTVCGYVYEGESLPPDFRCPLCHAPAEKFVKIEK